MTKRLPKVLQLHEYYVHCNIEPTSRTSQTYLLSGLEVLMRTHLSFQVINIPNTALKLVVRRILQSAFSVVIQNDTFHFEHISHEKFLKSKQIVSTYSSHFRFVILCKVNVTELNVGSKELQIRQLLKVMDRAL